MALTDRLQPNESSDRHLPNAEHLFQTTFTNSNADFHLARRSSELPVHGLPGLEIVGLDHDKKSPWNQPAEAHGRWEEIKKALGFGETVGERVHDQVLKGLTKEQQDLYKDEEAALRNYQMQDSLVQGPKPASPMHDLVNQKVKESESQTVEFVKAHMSPAERKELKKECKDMDDQYENWKKHFNPLGTGDFGPRIQAGLEVKKYFEEVAHAVEK